MVTSTNLDTDLSVAGIFRTVWPQATAKYAALATKRSHRTVQDWLQRRCTPSADTLLRMASENIELRAELIRRLEAYGYDGKSAASESGEKAAQMGSAVRKDRRSARSAAEADAVRGMK